MRAALWLMSLFAVAVASALFASNNVGTVSIFWTPYRFDVSLNLVIFGLVLVLLTLHWAQRALTAMFELPKQAKRWRLLQKERATHTALLEGMAQFMEGRFLRARKSAEAVLAREKSLSDAGEVLEHAGALRSVAHILAAESAHALQDKSARQHHLDLALQEPTVAYSSLRQSLVEGSMLRAARWSLDDRDAAESLLWLDRLPQGVSRRTLAMRLRLKAARLAGEPSQALDTALLLIKHRAFTSEAAASMVRSLVFELIAKTHELGQMQRLWTRLGEAQRQSSDLAIQAAQHWLQLKGDPAVARAWLKPIWNKLQPNNKQLSKAQQLKLVQALDMSFTGQDSPEEREWLVSIETAQKANPRDALLQFLAGRLCQKRQLWGKAQVLLAQAAPALEDPQLRRQAWRAVAELAEQREQLLTGNAACSIYPLGLKTNCM
jgi:HemY protein